MENTATPERACAGCGDDATTERDDMPLCKRCAAKVDLAAEKQEVRFAHLTR